MDAYITVGGGWEPQNAPVVELVVTTALGAVAFGREGSSPSGCTSTDVEVGRDGAYLRTEV